MTRETYWMHIGRLKGEYAVYNRLNNLVNKIFFLRGLYERLETEYG